MGGLRRCEFSSSLVCGQLDILRLMVETWETYHLGRFTGGASILRVGGSELESFGVTDLTLPIGVLLFKVDDDVGTVVYLSCLSELYE
jgi:hypothetical protein